MATLTVQEIKLTGLETTYASAASGGDEFLNTGREFIHVKNGDGSDHTVTCARQHTCSEGVTHNNAVVVTAGEERMIGPFVKRSFDDANQKVQITYDAVTSVTIAICRLDEDGL